MDVGEAKGGAINIFEVLAGIVKTGVRVRVSISISIVEPANSRTARFAETGPDE